MREEGKSRLVRWWEKGGREEGVVGDIGRAEVCGGRNRGLSKATKIYIYSMDMYMYFW